MAKERFKERVSVRVIITGVVRVRLRLIVTVWFRVRIRVRVIR